MRSKCGWAMGHPLLGSGRRRLSQAMEEQGAISKAARLLKMTYRKAWGQIKFMEEKLGLPLVGRETNRGKGWRRGFTHSRSPGYAF